MDGEPLSTLEFPHYSPDLFASLVVLALPDIGGSRYWQLRDRLGDAEKILSTPAASLQGHLPAVTCEALDDYQQSPDQHPLTRLAHNTIEWCAEQQITILSIDDDSYPALLRQLYAPPPLLYVRGEVQNLNLPQIAMVGSRNPSPAGGEDAFRFARQLADMGFVITSGLALGVDGAAHRGALAANAATIAVMGTGIDRIYPHRHRALAQEIIAKGGTLVSELPLGMKPQANHFPRRNRIISGMSLGVLVVEAALKSGSLITARYAMEQGREVFAIPGSIHNPVSRGCHALIKDGAALVESVDDMREPLQGLLSFKLDEITRACQKAKTPDLNGQEALVFTSIGYESTTIDTLQLRTQLAANVLMSVLVGLELKGLILHTAGGFQRKLEV